MAYGFPNGVKTLWEKEKLLVTSNFSFSHSVFKRLVLQICTNQGLFGKGLTGRQFARTQRQVRIRTCRHYLPFTVFIYSFDSLKILNFPRMGLSHNLYKSI